MDEDLKKYLDAQFAEVRSEIEGMEERVVERGTQRVEGRIDVAEDRMKVHVSKQCETVETNLLTEFQKWGRTSDMRTRTALTNAELLGERMLAVEDRISALERERSA
jgi:hypothetical protein